MIKFFPALVAKFLYDDEKGENSKFEVVKVREQKQKFQGFVIPCKYNWESKRLEKVKG